jgi:glycosyltransferase involved in cell wall biosynthesis
MTREPLKLLAIVPCPACFGLQNQTLALFGRRPSWIQCHFLNTRWTDGEFGRRLDALGIPYSSTWLGMISRKLDRENLWMTAECLSKLPIAWLNFLQLYRSFRPDVIYVAGYHDVILLWPLLVWLRSKVIYHMHDVPQENSFQRFIFFFWRRAVRRFLCVSNVVRVQLIRLGAPKATGDVLHPGVSVEPLTLPRRRGNRFCEAFGWPLDCVIFGSTGQLVSHKGVEDFIEAASLAGRSNPKMRFVIGGRGPVHYVEQLRQLVAARGMEQYISFGGWSSRASEFYEAIDVFVLASRHEDACPAVVAEAAERGSPSIATRSGGIVEVLLDGETGIVVEKSNPSDIARAMIRLAADEDLRTQMGRRARERSAKEFNIIVQAERFMNFLEASTSYA